MQAKHKLMLDTLRTGMIDHMEFGEPAYSEKDVEKMH